MMTKPTPLSTLVRRGALAGSVTITENITADNSTVLGYTAKDYWPNLYFSEAVVNYTWVPCLGEECASAELSVPWCHPLDKATTDIKDMARYTVRPKVEVGTLVRVPRDMILVVADVTAAGLCSNEDYCGRWVYRLRKAVRDDKD